MIAFRDKYMSGWERPRCRGVVHATALITLGMCTTWAFATRAPFIVITMLCAKMLSYGASVAYHFYPTQSVEHEYLLYSVDVLCINVAIWAPYAPCASRNGNELWWSTVALATACALTIITLPMERTRVAVQGLWAVVAIARIGHLLGYSYGWGAGTLAYAAAFACAPPMNRVYYPLPHHKRQWWGWHEDFHVMLTFADAIYLPLVYGHVAIRD